MTDWGMAGRKWKRGSGEGDNWWEVAKKERQFGSRSIGIRCIAFADHNAAWSKPLFAFLAQSPIMIGFFLARCCLGQVPGGAPFSQRSEQATACTNRMQIRN